jgi:hypothetical protein
MSCCTSSCPKNLSRVDNHNWLLMLDFMSLHRLNCFRTSPSVGIMGLQASVWVCFERLVIHSGTSDGNLKYHDSASFEDSWNQ